MRPFISLGVWAVVFCGTLAVLCSCRQEVSSHSAAGSNIVAQIGERSITIEEVTAVLNRRGRPPTAEGKRLALEEIIRSEAVLRAARTDGYYERPELRARFDQLVATEFTEKRLVPVLKAAEHVSEQEVRAYYDAHRGEFTSPEAVRAGVIFVSCSPRATQEKRADAMQRCETVRRAAKEADDAGFARLAQEYSEDQASRYGGGDTGWLSRSAKHEGSAAVLPPDVRSYDGRASKPSRWPDAVWQASFALSSPGEVAPVVETESGFYIVRLRERRVACERALTEVAESIRYLISREKRRDAEKRFYEDLAAGLRVEINEAAFNLIPGSSNTFGTKPPGLPGG